MPIESMYYEENDKIINIKNKDILDYVSFSKIKKAINKLSNENLLKYYNKYPFDTDEIIKNIKKSKLIFNCYNNDKIMVQIIFKSTYEIPSKSINNIKKWLNSQIHDGFGENGIFIDKYNLFLK
jgi:hypothetical protein